MARNNDRVIIESNDDTEKVIRVKISAVDESPLTTVQDGVQSGLAKTQSAVSGALDTVQGLFGRRKVKKTGKKAQKQLSKLTSTMQDSVQSGVAVGQSTLQKGQDIAQDAWKKNAKRAKKNLKKATSNLQDVSGTVQDTVQSGLGKGQSVVQSGLDVAQDAWKDNSKRAAKNLKKARKKATKNLKNLQGSMQDKAGLAQGAVAAGVGLAQLALKQNARRASKGLKKAKDNLGDVQDSFQHRLDHMARKRKRARFLFRLGLLAGIVAALLYAPRTGADMRRLVGTYLRQFVGLVQQGVQQGQSLLNDYSGTGTTIKPKTPVGTRTGTRTRY